jgi:hypothetical protein
VCRLARAASRPAAIALTAFARSDDRTRAPRAGFASVVRRVDE